jgi:hypothetical protein
LNIIALVFFEKLIELLHYYTLATQNR